MDKMETLRKMLAEMTDAELTELVMMAMQTEFEYGSNEISKDFREKINWMYDNFY